MSPLLCCRTHHHCRPFAVDPRALDRPARAGLPRGGVRADARPAAGRLRGGAGRDADVRQRPLRAGDPQHRHQPRLPRVRHPHHLRRTVGRLPRQPRRRRHRRVERHARERLADRSGLRPGAQREPRGLRPARPRRTGAAHPDPLPGPYPPGRRRGPGERHHAGLRNPRLRRRRGQREHREHLPADRLLRQPGRLRRLQRRGWVGPLRPPRLPLRRPLRGPRLRAGLHRGLVRRQRRHRQRGCVLAGRSPANATVSPPTPTRNCCCRRRSAPVPTPCPCAPGAPRAILPRASPSRAPRAPPGTATSRPSPSPGRPTA